LELEDFFLVEEDFDLVADFLTFEVPEELELEPERDLYLDDELDP
jgi:hypothetical protein